MGGASKSGRAYEPSGHYIPPEIMAATAAKMAQVVIKDQERLKPGKPGSLEDWRRLRLEVKELRTRNAELRNQVKDWEKLEPEYQEQIRQLSRWNWSNYLAAMLQKLLRL